MSHIDQSQLGQHTQYPQAYDPSLLFAVARQHNRQQLSVDTSQGYDVWTAYEVSWLNQHGLPQVAIAEFSIPANSPYIIESKSFKLYLNSLNDHRFTDANSMQQQVIHDLSACAQAIVSMKLHSVTQLPTADLPGQCLDQQAVHITAYTPSASLLSVDPTQTGLGEWHSHLLKSNCPVTDQPDWGSLFIRMHGEHLPSTDSLLAYVVSYRHHQGFHEHCVESIYNDLWQVFQPEALTVYARYVRRGGLDINPWRSNVDTTSPWPDMPRLARQ